MTQLPAWADLHDARERLVHALAASGLTPVEIAAKLSISAAEVEQLLALGDVDIPFPGSSRDQADAWRKRAQKLEREMLEATEGRILRLQLAGVVVQPPRESHIDALRCDPDPLRCGCQFWNQAAPPPGQHHASCPHYASPS